MIDKDEDKSEFKNILNSINKRNDILFFNEELFDENYGVIVSKANLNGTSRDFDFPNFKF